jgi:hypothetical protein
LGVMTRNLFLGKKRTGHQHLYYYSIGTEDVPPFPDPGVPDGLNIPLFAIFPNGVPFSLNTTFLASTKGVVSRLFLSSTDSSSDEPSLVKLPGSTNKQQREEVNKHEPAGLTILIILFFIRNFFADVGIIGDDVEAIDDGPGPASAVIVDTRCSMYTVC